MDGRISVLMGVYNAGSGVEDAVLSIVRQTYRDIEFIICDDGSSDSSYRILQKLSQQFSNIVLLRNEKNMGLAYSLNRCLACATGVYVARMDADDRSDERRFERQKAFLDAHPEYDLVGCEMIVLDEKGNKTYSRMREEPTEKVLPLEVPFAHPTIMMRRSAIERLGGYLVAKYTRRCEDVEFWYRFFHQGMRGYNLNEYLYIKEQGIDVYRRRKVVHGCELFRVHLMGLRLLKAPAYRYLLAVKPVISAMVPKRVMMMYHSIIFRNKRS